MTGPAVRGHQFGALGGHRLAGGPARPALLPSPCSRLTDASYTDMVAHCSTTCPTRRAACSRGHPGTRQGRAIYRAATRLPPARRVRGRAHRPPQGRPRRRVPGPRDHRRLPLPYPHRRLSVAHRRRPGTRPVMALRARLPARTPSPSCARSASSTAPSPRSRWNWTAGRLGWPWASKSSVRLSDHPPPAYAGGQATVRPTGRRSARSSRSSSASSRSSRASSRRRRRRSTSSSTSTRTTTTSGTSTGSTPGRRRRRALDPARRRRRLTAAVPPRRSST